VQTLHGLRRVCPVCTGETDDDTLHRADPVPAAQTQHGLREAYPVCASELGDER